jgi:hypothetical protein
VLGAGQLSLTVGTIILTQMCIAAVVGSVRGDISALRVHVMSSAVIAGDITAGRGGSTGHALRVCVCVSVCDSVCLCVCVFVRV